MYFGLFNPHNNPMKVILLVSLILIDEEIGSREAKGVAQN